MRMLNTQKVQPLALDFPFFLNGLIVISGANIRVIAVYRQVDLQRKQSGKNLYDLFRQHLAVCEHTQHAFVIFSEFPEQGEGFRMTEYFVRFRTGLHEQCLSVFEIFQSRVYFIHRNKRFQRSQRGRITLLEAKRATRIAGALNIALDMFG